MGINRFKEFLILDCRLKIDPIQDTVFRNPKSLLDSGNSICYLCGDQITALPILAQDVISPDI